ncbi:MAG: hypothetical protein ACI8Z5_001166 [Lentimonas sp.]|jgi:hypothetical protein
MSFDSSFVQNAFISEAYNTTMLLLRTLLPLALLMACSHLHAGNFTLNTKESTLAADAKASPPHSFTNTATTFTTDIEINPKTLEVTKAACRFKFADIGIKKRAE